MVILVVLVLSLVALGVLASRFGVDSRDGKDWQPRNWQPYDVMTPRRLP